MSETNTIRRRMIIDDMELVCPAIEFSHEHGQAKTYLDTRTNTLMIDDLYVNQNERQRGIGKALLEAVRTLGDEIGVDRVEATIVSRECLEAMRQVFGEESVKTRREGMYRPHDGPLPDNFTVTSASLSYQPVASIIQES